MPAGTLTWSAVRAPKRADERDAVGSDAVARVLAGDEAAWDELFRLYNHQVVLAVIAKGVAPSTARDVAQDAWLRIIEQQRRGRLATLSLPALVITQALFLAKDAARRPSARQPHRVLDESDARIDVEQQLIDRDRLARATAALARCADSQQRVFRAIYARPGSSAAEVATETGLSVQRVRQIVCEVRKQLRAALKGEA